MRWFLFISMTCFSVAVFAQHQVSGKIFRRDTNEALSYAVIGIAGKATGTISRQDGGYRLTLGEAVLPSDTVAFSYVGFRTEYFTVEELTGAEKDVYLEQEPVDIPTVVVTNRKSRERKIGRSTTGTGFTHWNFFMSDYKQPENLIGCELAMRTDFKNDSRINSLCFNISANTFEWIRLRINIYEVEEDTPTDLFLQEDIQVDLNDKFKGWKDVDLAAYGLYVPAGKSLAVSFMVVDCQPTEDLERQWITLPASMITGHTTYTRKQPMDEWEKMNAAVSFYLNTTVYPD